MSFQDRLAAMHAANAEAAERETRRQGRIRAHEYELGEATAANIIGRVATFGSTAERNQATLQIAARHQGSSLSGRVAAGLLSEAAGDLAPAVSHAQDLEAKAERLRAEGERLREQHYARAREDDRAWHRDRER